MFDERKRVKEIDKKLEELIVAMNKAQENGDWESYDMLQTRYNNFINMRLNISDSRKWKTENKVGIFRIIADLIGTAGTIFVAILGIKKATEADENSTIVNQRTWNIGLDFLKRTKK